MDGISPPGPSSRTLSQPESAFVEELSLFDRVVAATCLVSWNQHGLVTDGRGVRGMKIFTRQTILGLSLQRIVPRPSSDSPVEAELWDICSLASLARNLLDGWLSLHYFSLESVSEREAELRFLLAQLHRNTEWYAIRKETSPNDPKLKEFELGLPKERQRVHSHPALAALTPQQRNLVRNEREIYKTKADFEQLAGTFSNLRRNYRLLSNLVHPLPLFIERIDNQRGRGIAAESDVNYCIVCLAIARSSLAASTVGIVDRFADSLGARFSAEIDSLRPLVAPEIPSV